MMKAKSQPVAVRSEPGEHDLDPFGVFPPRSSTPEINHASEEEENITGNGGHTIEAVFAVAKKGRIECGLTVDSGTSQPSTFTAQEPSTVTPHTSDCTQETQEKKETLEANDIKDTQESQEMEECDDKEEINEVNFLGEELTNLNTHFNFYIRTAIQKRSFREDYCEAKGNDPLFDLARDLKTIEHLGECKFNDRTLWTIFSTWECLNRKHLKPESDFTVFLEKLSLVQFGTGQGLHTLLRKGCQQPIPPGAENLRPLAQDLARLCRELARLSGGEFHLACKAAGDVVGVCPNTALTCLRSLEAVGIIRKVKLGTKPTWNHQFFAGVLKPVKQKGEATVYAYLAEDL